MNIIVAGIGTEVGKTVVSAILCEALHADYWKPVQAGSLDDSDSDCVTRLLGNSECTTWPEAYRLSQPMSPHAAASIDGVDIEIKHLVARQAHMASGTPDKNLIIELAGGLMVPLSQHMSTIDFVQALASPVVLVANYYLGSINHSLLSLHLLKARRIPVLGIIFNGEPNLHSRDIILRQGEVELLGEIPHSPHLTPDFIRTHAEKILKNPTMAGL